MTLRIGLIGCGDIGKLRAEAVGKSPSVRLTAVSDLDAQRAGGIATAYGAAVAADWQSLVRRDDVDVVLVSTPPGLHSQMCIESFRAGKHVLCEKPLGRTAAECRSILEAADAAGRVLATGFNYRFYPSVLKAKQLFDSGIIGELDHVRSYTGYSATAHSHPWLHDVKMMGGGALRDNGVHLIDLTCYFLGDPTHTQGLATNGVWKFEGCEDNGFVLMKNAKGNIATVQASWTEWRGYRLMVEVYGTLGCIRVSCFPMVTEVVWSGKVGGPTRRKKHWFPWVHLMEHVKSYRWVVVESFIQEFEALAGTLRGEVTPLAIGYDGVRAIEVAEAGGL